MKLLDKIHLRGLADFIKRYRWRIAVISLALVMAVQILYPYDRLPPQAYLGEQPVGFKRISIVREELSARQKSVTVQFNGKPATIDPRQAGVYLDIEKSLDNLPAVEWYERAVPLLPIAKSFQKKSSEPVIRRDAAKLDRFSKDIARKRYREPVNASAKVKDAKLVITEAKAGEDYTAEAIRKAFSTEDPFTGKTIRFTAKVIPAAIQAKDFEHIKPAFAAATAQPLKVRYGTTTKEITAAELASLLTITVPGGVKKAELIFDAPALDALLAGWNKEYTIAPGTTQLKFVDNAEVSRKNGASGRSLNEEAIRGQLAAWLAEPAGEPVALATQVLAPTISATRFYSQSSAGLLAKLTYWLQTHSGSYQVAIQELGGQGREASYNVTQQTVMASTYKTFLAYVAYKQAESGALDLNLGLVKGKNIEQCIEIMIVNSDNECAIALGRHIGWAKVDTIIASSGFSNVKLNNYDASGKMVGDKLVNAKEQANFIAQLSAGKLMNEPHTARLMDYMKRQVYRSGIPAGSRGAIVADKVGFLEGYLHDVGIVYGPKATYALVIMSKGSSWSAISDLSRAVYDFMNE